MFADFFTKTALIGWLWRRVQELASWATALTPLWLSLPERHQELIIGILSGKGGGYTISAYAGFAYYLFTQWQSLKATVQPQIVTEDGEKVKTKELPKAKKTLVEEMANVAVAKKAADRKPNLLDKLFGR